MAQRPVEGVLDRAGVAPAVGDRVYRRLVHPERRAEGREQQLELLLGGASGWRAAASGWVRDSGPQRAAGLLESATRAIGPRGPARRRRRRPAAGRRRPSGRGTGPSSLPTRPPPGPVAPRRGGRLGPDRDQHPLEDAVDAVGVASRHPAPTGSMAAMRTCCSTRSPRARWFSAHPGHPDEAGPVGRPLRSDPTPTRRTSPSTARRGHQRASSPPSAGRSGRARGRTGRHGRSASPTGRAGWTYVRPARGTSRTWTGRPWSWRCGRPSAPPAPTTTFGRGSAKGHRVRQRLMEMRWA